MTTGKGESVCPVCGKPLRYHDRAKRIVLLEEHIPQEYWIRRLQCTGCGMIHRELPDCMVPYKQYCAEVISGALDGIITPDDCDSEDYPCAMTIQRWLSWLTINIDRIDGYLKSIGYRILEFSKDLLNSRTPMLEAIRRSCENWLEIILRLIYNSGGSLVPFKDG